MMDGWVGVIVVWEWAAIGVAVGVKVGRVIVGVGLSLEVGWGWRVAVELWLIWVGVSVEIGVVCWRHGWRFHRNGGIVMVGVIHYCVAILGFDGFKISKSLAYSVSTDLSW